MTIPFESLDPVTLLEDSINRAELRIRNLETLVRWLAITWGDNEPVFAGADGLGTVDGWPAPEPLMLQDLYRQIMGPPKQPVREGDLWQKCEGCGTWHFVRDLPAPEILASPGG